MRTCSITSQLAKKAGVAEFVDERSVEGHGGAIRVRINLDVRKPLTRCASPTLRKKKVYFNFEYEKMPMFCGVCDFVSHVAKEHGNVVQAASDIIYLPTLIAFEHRREDYSFQRGGGNKGG